MAYQSGDVLTKKRGNLLGSGVGVLNGIMQKSGDLQIRIGVHIGENLQHLQRMEDIRQRGALAQSSGVPFYSKNNGFVDAGVIARHKRAAGAALTLRLISFRLRRNFPAGKVVVFDALHNGVTDRLGDVRFADRTEKCNLVRWVHGRTPFPQIVVYSCIVY